jgi:prepilin-type N-terminal cleavage/methylation domain-containing protein/prepilin-type processing-associated H-X9-DG protein
MDELGKKKGFTLVELLIAIVIIGILMSLLIPAVSKVMENARRVKGSSCLRQIAMAYTQYCNDDVNGRNIPAGDTCKSGKAWAMILAKAGYLNDPNVYCFSGDSGAAKVVKKSIVELTTLKDNDAWGDNPEEFSVYLVAGVPTDAPTTTTPIAFTRGLPSTLHDRVEGGDTVAKWPSTGVYGTKGGYIAFLDGHVEWFDDLGTEKEDGGKLMAWDSGGTTNDIEAALPTGALILNAGATVKTIGE